MTEHTITDAEITRIVKEAMREGAAEARKALGIPDDEREAKKFVAALKEAANVVEAYRVAKKAVWTGFWGTAGKFIAVATFGAIIVTLGWDKLPRL